MNRSELASPISLKISHMRDLTTFSICSQKFWIFISPSASPYLPPHSGCPTVQLSTKDRERREIMIHLQMWSPLPLVSREGGAEWGSLGDSMLYFCIALQEIVWNGLQYKNTLSCSSYLNVHTEGQCIKSKQAVWAEHLLCRWLLLKSNIISGPFLESRKLLIRVFAWRLM